MYMGDPELVISLARAYVFLGNSKQKICDLLSEHKSSDQFSSGQSAFLQALYFKSEDKLEDSASVLACAVEKDPSAVELWLELGQVQVKAGSADIAMHAFLKVSTHKSVRLERIVKSEMIRSC